MAKKPEPHAHAKLIDQLGGPAEVARKINARKIGRPLSPQSISMWKRRGVSVFLRNLFAELLVEHGLKVPKGFTASRHRGW